MSDKILQKYMAKAAEKVVAPEVTDETEAADDLGAFGWLRGVRDRAIMLELRKKDGNIVAIGYSWLERVEFDRSEGITLYVMGQKIGIKGRNLNGEVRPNVRLFQGIVRHKVPWIQEAEPTAGLRAERQATIVEDIKL
jgi:hypothetical protein